MQRKFILLFLFIVHHILGVSQSFVQLQESVFRNSESQWLCTELEKVNPEHFNCQPKQTTWEIPSSNAIVIFNQNLELHDTDKVAFNALLFPNNDCKRYLKLVSLCDLYFPLIRKKVEQHRLSLDYQYLPLLLSGLNTSLRTGSSRSGLWSLEYLVARKYGLRIDESIDERNGGDFTTDAAAKYLSDLNALYDGDAFKIITAFRKGAPFVNRIEQERGGLSFYAALDEDSKSFIKLMAYMKSVIASTRTENQLSNYFDIFGQYEGVFAEQNMKVSSMARLLKVTESALKQPNPVFIGNNLEANYRKVPFMLQNTVVSKFHFLKDSIAQYEEIVLAPVVKAEKKYHTVRKGESLGVIARKYKVSVSQIKKWNALRSDRINIGERLIVGQESKPKPQVVVEKKPDVTAKPKESTTVETINDAKEKKKKVESIQKDDTSNKITYTVKSGDSMWKIAQKYKGVTEHDIMKWNKCGSRISPGQKLVIYTK